MTSQQLLFLLIVFAVVAGLALLAARLFAPSLMRHRLARMVAPGSGDTADARQGWVERAAKVAKPFMKLSLPEEGWEKSPLRIRFMNASWRSQSAPVFYFSAKTVLALLLPALLLAFTLPQLPSATTCPMCCWRAPSCCASARFLKCSPMRSTC